MKIKHWLYGLVATAALSFSTIIIGGGICSVGSYYEPEVPAELR